MEHITGRAPEVKARLVRGLDGFLDKARDRDLFELAGGLSGMRALVIALVLSSAGSLAQDSAPPPFEGTANTFLGVTGVTPSWWTVEIA